MDFPFVAGYAHVDAHGAQKDRRPQERRRKHFWHGLSLLMDLLPARTAPVLVVDADARVGSIGSEPH
eukprot:8511821-Pyramimonas_sp.AAC.1